MGNLFSIETETKPENKLEIDANNNSTVRDASGNIITISSNNNNHFENGLNPHNFVAVLAPIDLFGNRVIKR
jgi:hypothetical protein